MRQSAVVLVLLASLTASGDEPKQAVAPWRYFVLPLQRGAARAEYIEQVLNGMSEDGWEFYQGMPFSDKDGPSSVELVFRRRLSEKERTDAAAELRRLEGVWVLASTHDGEQNKKGDGNTRLMVKPGTWELTPEAQPQDPFHGLTGPSKLVAISGKTISMHHGRWITWCICKVEGDRLHVCSALSGPRRPGGFAGERGRFVYTVWDRKKE